MAYTSTQAAPAHEHKTEPVETNPAPQPKPKETPFVIKITGYVPG